MRLIPIPLVFVILLLHSNTVSAQPKSPLESKIISFMTGLQSENPKQTVELWILGVENRSGLFSMPCFHQISKAKQKNNSKKEAGILGNQALG